MAASVGQEGDKVRLKDGSIAVVQGGRLVAVPNAPGAPTAPRQMAKEDRTTLDNLNESAHSAREVISQYDEAGPLAQRLGTGQAKGMMMNAATQQDGGGFVHNLLAAPIGGVLRTIGAISPQMDADYQRLKAIQSRRVLAEQTLQKGVQTEGDAARIKQADISPYNAPEAFESNANAGKAAAGRVINRAAFYSAWANKYGLNGLNEQGLPVEQAFQQSGSQPTQPKRFKYDPKTGKIQ